MRRKLKIIIGHTPATKSEHKSILESKNLIVRCLTKLVY